MRKRKLKRMERMTVKTDEPYGYVLKEMCGFDRTGEIDDIDGCNDMCDKYDTCVECPINKAINLLADYENTGLTPEEITLLKQKMGYNHG